MSNEQHYLFINVCVALVLLFQINIVNGIECGTVNLQRSTILGGSQTLKGEWPFIAALYRNNKSEFFCGGTVISNRHVLTGNNIVCCELLELITKN